MRVEVLAAGGRSGGRTKGCVDRLVVGVRESEEQDGSKDPGLSAGQKGRAAAS